MKFNQILAGSLLLTLSVTAHADAIDVWKKILKKCSDTKLIGRQQLFFGLSNSVGPGSVWRLADDRSLRMRFELSDAIPNQADRDKLISKGPILQCSGDSTTNWSVGLGLPFSTGATPITAEIGAILGRAKKVSVSVSSYSIDQLKEVPWKAEFDKLAPNNAYSADLKSQNRLLAANSVKVGGLRATFTFATKLGADVQARFKGQDFILGTPTPAPSTGTSTAVAIATTPATTSTNTPSTPAVPAVEATTQPGACNKAMGTSAAATTVASTVPQSTSGAARLHVEVVTDNTIVVCADGPSYLLAAYTKLLNGAPTGVGPGQPQLIDAKLPKGIIAKRDE